MTSRRFLQCIGVLIGLAGLLVGLDAIAGPGDQSGNAITGALLIGAGFWLIYFADQ